MNNKDKPEVKVLLGGHAASRRVNTESPVVKEAMELFGQYLEDEFGVLKEKDPVLDPHLSKILDEVVRDMGCHVPHYNQTLLSMAFREGFDPLDVTLKGKELSVGLGMLNEKLKENWITGFSTDPLPGRDELIDRIRKAKIQFLLDESRSAYRRHCVVGHELGFLPPIQHSHPEPTHLVRYLGNVRSPNANNRVYMTPPKGLTPWWDDSSEKEQPEDGSRNVLGGDLDRHVRKLGFRSIQDYLESSDYAAPDTRKPRDLLDMKKHGLLNKSFKPSSKKPY